jgi:hypothetical protein
MYRHAYGGKKSEKYSETSKRDHPSSQDHEVLKDLTKMPTKKQTALHHTAQSTKQPRGTTKVQIDHPTMFGKRQNVTTMTAMKPVMVTDPSASDARNHHQHDSLFSERSMVFLLV